MGAVLIVAPSWVGDMVMAQSLFKVLKAQNAGRAIDVLAPGWTRALLERMPEVRNAIEMPLGHGQLQLMTRRHLGVSLRTAGYEQAILLPNSFKSALIPYWARIPRRTGYTGELRQWLLTDGRKLDRQRLTQTVQRFVALGLPDGAVLKDPVPEPALETSKENGRAAVQRLGLETGQLPILALCPGAEFGPAKKWPEAYYAEVARSWLEKGWQVWLFGSVNDVPVCNRINTLAGSACEILAGQTRLEDAIDLLAIATFVVTNDSGLMHVAAALQRPMVAIYGSSDPCFTPPLSGAAQIERLGLDCSPCFKRECPLGHLNCLNDLLPERVITAMEEVMK
ncbi:MAG: lipopolysaccharide heptosyltransferase II [Gammaproteobacteria bacterium]|jgi:heptosyltransferase-2|nr:lipopolysaccharide heptosyltransferase II [Gammaproteobacteria bacterium]MDH3986255.1 lipopolysaccharide heptosyltransferase II [Gammaproteobacteria bacterium]